MSMVRWQYQPFGLQQFPLGEGPFRIRGLAYMTALKYVDTRLRGGRAAFLDALGKGDPYAPYYDRIFLVATDYDISPLLRLYAVVAALEGVEIGDFIGQRSRWSAESTIKGVWKPILKTTSPEIMAGTLPQAFDRFFQPCHAEGIEHRPHYFECELSKLPISMTGMFVSSTIGFVSESLEIAGAKGCRIEMARPTSDGDLLGVSLCRVRFVATWR